MTTRSTVLVVAQVTAPSYVELYTCPANFTVLVKSIYVNRAVGTSGSFSVFASRAGVGLVSVFFEPDVTRTTSTENQPWIVLEPGDQLFGLSADGDIYVWVSGALLPLTGT